MVSGQELLAFAANFPNNSCPWSFKAKLQVTSCSGLQILVLSKSYLCADDGIMSQIHCQCYFAQGPKGPHAAYWAICKEP